jgi:hypothetical protein
MKCVPPELVKSTPLNPLLQASIQCTNKPDASTLKDYVDNAEKMSHKGELQSINFLKIYLTLSISVELRPKQPHPLAYIQLERVNELLGFQEIELLPEPILASSASTTSHSHVIIKFNVSSNTRRCV